MTKSCDQSLLMQNKIYFCALTYASPVILRVTYFDIFRPGLYFLQN